MRYNIIKLKDMYGVSVFKIVVLCNVQNIQCFEAVPSMHV